MLNENIKKLRKAKGLSQEELAIKLNVVRQTVSKWEKAMLNNYILKIRNIQNRNICLLKKARNY